MKRLFPTLTLLALTLAISTSAFGQAAAPAPAAAPAATPAPVVKKKKEKPPVAAATPAPAATPAGPRTIGMYVKVDGIDLATKTFTHTNKDGAVVKFVVTEKTEIKNGDVPAKLEDIKVGDTVSGSRIKKSATEYEVARITRFKAMAQAEAKGDASKKDPAKKK